MDVSVRKKVLAMQHFEKVPVPYALPHVDWMTGCLPPLGTPLEDILILKM